MSSPTTKAPCRRTLKFETLDQTVEDASRMASMPHRALGNWSLGQICQHLAEPPTMALDGAKFTVPLYIRLVAPLLKKRLLTKPMKAGLKLPPGAAKVLVPDATEDEAGLAKYRQAIERFKAEPTRHPHPFLGAMTKDEWTQILLRHAELHLSFIVPVT